MGTGYCLTEKVPGLSVQRGVSLGSPGGPSMVLPNPCVQVLRLQGEVNPDDNNISGICHVLPE